MMNTITILKPWFNYLAEYLFKNVQLNKYIFRRAKNDSLWNLYLADVMQSTWYLKQNFDCRVSLYIRYQLLKSTYYCSPGKKGSSRV